MRADQPGVTDIPANRTPRDALGSMQATTVISWWQRIMDGSRAAKRGREIHSEDEEVLGGGAELHGTWDQRVPLDRPAAPQYPRSIPAVSPK